MSTIEADRRLPDENPAPAAHDPDERASEPNRTEAEAAKPAQPGESRKPRRWLSLPIVAAILAGLVMLGAALIWWLNARHYESSDDAFIDARSSSAAPEVGGRIVAVPVEDNQHVDAGSTLVRIDDRSYRAALAEASAQVQSAQASIAAIEAQVAVQQIQIERAQAEVRQADAALRFAQQEADRYTKLEQTAGGTVQKAEQSTSQLRQRQADARSAQASVDAAIRQNAVLAAQRAGAEASLVQARARRERAELDLEHTVIRAPRHGHVARLSAAQGQYVQPGQALMVFVPDQVWVTANFKETQLTDMRRGQPVTLSIDAYPDRDIRGHVDSIQSGSGTAFSLLPAENATGNYVKVVQRVPVKITVDEVPPDLVLGPGMSVVPSVRVR